MKTLEEIKQEIRGNIRFVNLNPPVTGGQQCGIRRPIYRLESDELELKIEFNYHRSVLANREVMTTIFELILDETVK